MRSTHSQVPATALCLTVDKSSLRPTSMKTSTGDL